MPTISVFYGIVIQMFWRDHNPPHFMLSTESMKRSLICATYACYAGSCPAVQWFWFWNGRPIIEMNSWRTGRYAANSNPPGRSVP